MSGTASSERRGAARPVLLLDGTGRVVVGIARCLARHGIPVDLAQYSHPQPPSVRSRYLRRIHRLPPWQRNDFPEALLRVAAEGRYDMLIPTTDEALLAIRPCEQELRSRLWVACPSADVVDRVLNKSATLEIAAAAGVPVPAEFQFSSVEEFERAVERLPYPLVAKGASKEKVSGFSVRYFRSPAELRAFAAATPGFLANYLLQEFIPGAGAGVEVLFWDGKPVTVFQHRRLKELPADGGVSVLCQAESADPVLAAHAAKLLAALEWQGVAMVEFRADPATGKAALMEVNGRYWGSLPLSLNAGVEFPYYEWLLVHGGRPEPSPYRNGFRTDWRNGEVLRIISLISAWRKGKTGVGRVIGETLGAARDIFSPVPDAIWDWSDPQSAWTEFGDNLVSGPAHAIGRRLVPPAVRAAVRVARHWGLAAGWVHFRESGQLPEELPLPAPVRRVLFVCSGNIMRSPLAEELMRREEPGLEVGSAGLLATAGSVADSRMVNAAAARGVDLQGHSAKLLTPEMVANYDLILIMDRLNSALFASRFASAVPKVRWLGSYLAADGRRREIADPNSGTLADSVSCFSEIERAVTNLANAIRSGRG